MLLGTEIKGRKNVLGLARTSANLGKQQINTERSVLVVEVALELGNLLLEHVGGVTDTANDAETASVGDGGGQLGAGGNVHAGKKHGVLDAEHVGDGGTDLLWIAISHVSPPASLFCSLFVEFSFLSFSLETKLCHCLPRGERKNWEGKNTHVGRPL